MKNYMVLADEISVLWILDADRRKWNIGSPLMRAGLKVWKTYSWGVYIQFFNLSFSWDSFLEIPFLIFENPITGITSIDAYNLGSYQLLGTRMGWQQQEHMLTPLTIPSCLRLQTLTVPMYSCFRSSKTSGRWHMMISKVNFVINDVK